MCWKYFCSETKITPLFYHKILHDVRNFRVLNSMQMSQIAQLSEDEKLEIICHSLFTRKTLIKTSQ